MELTIADLLSIAPEANAEIIASLIGPLNTYLPAYGINTPHRVAMFIAQWGEETDGFQTLEEYASGVAYNGRKDLGNVEPGDGPRFKGRGLPMLTGRTNYQIYGTLVGVDLVANPDQAADPVLSVRIACLFWQRHGLNAWADAGNVRQATYLINGGENGLSRRETYFNELYLTLLKQVVPPIPLPRPGVPDAPTAGGPIAVNPTPPIWRTPEGTMFGTAAISQLGMLFTGATGPLAWAVSFVIVVAVVVGLVYLWKRMHRGQ